MTLFVSSQCGTGKTYSTGLHFSEHLDEGNHLYIAPTIKLLHQSKDEFAKVGDLRLYPELICSDDHKQTIKAIMSKLKYAPYDHEVLMITQTALLGLPYFWHPENWHVYVDEVPQVDEPYKYPLPRSWELLAEHIEVDEKVGVDVYLMKAKGKDELEKILKNKAHDAVFDLFRSLLEKLISDYYQVFANTQTVRRLQGIGFVQTRKKEKANPNANYLYFVSMLHPNAFNRGFASVTFLGADIEYTLLYKWFTQYHGETWVVNDDIKRRLRPSRHIGHLMTIKYFTDRARGFSKYFGRLDSNIEHLTNNEAMARWVKREFVGQEYAVFGNKSPYPSTSSSHATNAFDSAVFKGDRCARCVSPYCHGMNDMDHINNIFFSAAMNREPWHLQILEGLGFTQREIQQATAHYAANQALMRSSLRRPDSQEHVTLICTDRSMAHTIAQITGCAAIHKIDNVVKDKPPAMTTAERSLKYRLKKNGLLSVN